MTRSLVVWLAVGVVVAVPGRVQPALRTARGLELSPVHAAAVERALTGSTRSA